MNVRFPVRHRRWTIITCEAGPAAVLIPRRVEYNFGVWPHSALRIISDLPDDATWDDVMKSIYVRQTIEAGVRDSEEGKTIDVKALREKLGLSK